MDELGLGHKLTRVRQPQTSGKAERFIQTLTNESAYARMYTSNSARLDDFPRWVYRYNAHRRHTALGGLSPSMLSTTAVGTTASYRRVTLAAASKLPPEAHC